MMSLGVISKVHEPSEWVNSLVLVEKRNKSLRVCLDPRNLNNAIKRSHYPLPTIENIRSKLIGAKYFSTLDAQSGFWMIKLDESSSNLCVFGTPFGRYKFLRLPYGVSCAPEIFHKTMSEIFEDIPGVLIYLDDILIFSDSIDGHNAILRKVLERAHQKNVKFNMEKCNFFMSEVQYLGHIFSANGMCPDPRKVSAICQLESPKNVSDLKRFLGMVNYLGTYIDNLSDKTTSLRQLLKKNNSFYWDTAHQREFDSLKEIISKTPVLTYFDPSCPLTLSVDSSQFAVGAVILQNKKPIAYASRSLTDCQSRYAQIEKELYAIQFGCNKFRQYIYGRPVNVETDHKPLVTLFKKPLSEVPPRLQRMMLTLQQYDLKVSYTPGKFLYIADTLSRAPVEPPDDDDAMEEDLHIHMNLLVSNLAVTPEKLQEIKFATEMDSELQRIIQYCKTDWPKSKNQVHSSIKPYYSFRHELHVIDGLVFKNNLLVVPSNMRCQILELIHEGHLGIDRCLRQARSVVFWPNISVDIKNQVEQCSSCLKYRNSNPVQPLLPHTPSTLPWQKLGIDFFYYEKITYLLVVDYFSNYFELVTVNSTNAAEVIKNLKSIFARHGIPSIIVSDNGPPFHSQEFKDFLYTWEISHHTSSPHFPRSNGLVERTVATVKALFNKCQESKSDPYIALLHYRNTPQASGYSPAQLLMSRQLRMKLPISEAALKPKVIDYARYSQFVNDSVAKMKNYHDQHARNLPNISLGDKVMYKKCPGSPWQPASVVQVGPMPRAFLVRTPEGVEFRRNRQHLLKLNSPIRGVNEPVAVENEDSLVESDCPQNASIIQSPKTVPQSSIPTGVFTRGGRQIFKPRRFTFSEDSS